VLSLFLFNWHHRRESPNGVTIDVRNQANEVSRDYAQRTSHHVCCIVSSAKSPWRRLSCVASHSTCWSIDRMNHSGLISASQPCSRSRCSSSLRMHTTSSLSTATPSSTGYFLSVNVNRISSGESARCTETQSAAIVLSSGNPNDLNFLTETLWSEIYEAAVSEIICLAVVKPETVTLQVIKHPRSLLVITLAKVDRF